MEVFPKRGAQIFPINREGLVKYRLVLKREISLILVLTKLEKGGSGALLHTMNKVFERFLNVVRHWKFQVVGLFLDTVFQRNNFSRHF